MRTIYQLNLITCSLYYPTLEEAEDIKRELEIGDINVLTNVPKDVAHYLLTNEGK